MNTASHTTESYSPDSLVVDGDGLYSRGGVLIAGQNLTRGAVLGKITASDKYTLSLAAAGDGSQVPVAILVEDTDASGGDVNTPVYRGGFFDENKLVLGAGHTVSSILDQLNDVGIKLVSGISA